jgi:hypothetical protein
MTGQQLQQMGSVTGQQMQHLQQMGSVSGQQLGSMMEGDVTMAASQTVKMKAVVAQAAAEVKAETPMKLTDATRPSSMFMSTTTRSPTANNMLDRCYFPYNEALVKPRSNKGAFVEFAAQQDRGALRGKNEVTSMDVVYNPKDHDAWRSKAALSMDKALPRACPGASLFEVAMPQPHAMNDGSVYHVEDIKLRRSPSPTPNFDTMKAHGEEVAWLCGSGTGDQSSDYNYKETDRTRKGRRSPVWKLDASPAKPRPRLQNIHHDLDYDVNLEAVQRKTVFTNLDHGKAHRDLWEKSLTAACNYEPRDNLVRPRSHCAGDFNKMASFRPAANKSLDRFYDTDTAMTKQRVKGNPMLRTHMSRDKRIAALRKHTPSPDAFYDYNMEKVLPRHNPGNADFSKNTSRSHKVSAMIPVNPALQVGSPSKDLHYRMEASA